MTMNNSLQEIYNSTA